MKNLSIIAACIVVFLLSTVSAASAQDCKVIDLRTEWQICPMFIDICSMPTSYFGHTFAYFSAHNTAWGYNPVNARLTCVGGCAGVITSGTETSAWRCGRVNARLRIYVNRSKYNLAISVVQRWMLRPGSYALATRNCVTFCEDIAQAIGIRYTRNVRYAVDTPLRWVRDLIRRN